jgi:GTPase-activator protein for Ras-like GTPase
LWED